jgi:hypothetical protein
MLRMTRSVHTAGLGAALVALVALAAPAAASAALPDVQILSVQPSQATVPVGIPTKVTFVLNLRNNGDPTTAANTDIGPVGGAPTFTNIRMFAQDFDQWGVKTSSCTPPGGDAPRCHVGFTARGQTQVVEVTDTVLAGAAGPITRSFTADVLAPDSDPDASDNVAAATLAAVPGRLPTISGVTDTGAGSLTPGQRRRAVGKVVFGLDRAADLTITVERRGAHGGYVRWGRFFRGAVAGANVQLINRRVAERADPPINIKLNPMRAGTYRLTLVATDVDGIRSRPVKRVLVVPRTR